MNTDNQTVQVRKLLKEFEHMSYVELQLILHRCLEERMITDEDLVAKVLEAKKYGIPEEAPVMSHGSGKEYIKPGCVQHDCEKCKKQEELLEAIDQMFSNAVDANDRSMIEEIKELDAKLKRLDFLDGWVHTMYDIVSSNTYGPADKLAHMEAILGACIQHIKEQST